MLNRYERDIERYAARLAKIHNCLFYKLNGPPGMPDRLLITPDGVIFFIEFKRPGGKLSLRQETRIRELEDHGANVLILGSKEAVRTFFLSAESD
jgi:hypothetical protein